MNKVHYNVTGLQNTNMKTQLKNALDKIEGVQSVSVDLGQGSIEVGYSKAASEDDIRGCVENVGCKIEN
jgi:copper chaperone CopZ